MLTPLKAARLKRGLKQIEVAKKLGIGVSYLCGLENNREPVPLRYLVALAKLYDCHAEDLRSGQVMILRS